MRQPINQQSKVINFKPIGDVVFRKSKRAKRYRITIKEDKTVILTIPNSASFKSGEKIVRDKLSWIEKHLSKMNSAASDKLYFDEKTKFSTRKHALHFKTSEEDKITVFISDKKITVKYPKYLNVHSDEVQHAARFGIVEALRDEAKQFIPQRVVLFAEKFGFDFKNIYIKNLKSRWGSCSNVNNINLNLHLMRIPNRLIDYVILHELAHTVEKNHGKNFWILLDRITDNKARLLDKELNKFSLSL